MRVLFELWEAEHGRLGKGWRSQAAAAAEASSGAAEERLATCPVLV
jgi:hypothetical protein